MAPENERVTAIRAALGLNREQMAEAIGLKMTAYKQIEQGARAVNIRHIKTLHLMFNVNEEWVLTGKGEMFLDRLGRLQSFLQEQWQLTAEETAFIVKLISAPRDQRQAFLSALDVLNKMRQ